MTMNKEKVIVTTQWTIDDSFKSESLTSLSPAFDALSEGWKDLLETDPEGARANTPCCLQPEVHI